jgi:hypothetical protein
MKFGVLELEEGVGDQPEMLHFNVAISLQAEAEAGAGAGVGQETPGGLEEVEGAALPEPHQHQIVSR